MGTNGFRMEISGISDERNRPLITQSRKDSRYIGLCRPECKVFVRVRTTSENPRVAAAVICSNHPTIAWSVQGSDHADTSRTLGGDIHQLPARRRRAAVIVAVTFHTRRRARWRAGRRLHHRGLGHYAACGADRTHAVISLGKAASCCEMARRPRSQFGCKRLTNS